MILLTGGTGFIASHTATVLCDSGYDVVLVDNLINSKADVVTGLETITGKTIPFEKVDICDTDALRGVFKKYDISAVIHFASLKAVGESVEKPDLYYENNIGGTESLLTVMEENSVKKLVFSSSATVYGAPEYCPIDEDHSLSATNPYGETKIAIEEILRAVHAEDSSWEIALLRYFNPIGAHSSGIIGEDPSGIPNNLAPYICKVITGELPHLNVLGDDYDTIDGTGVRDYIHVMDLARGHLKALENLSEFDCRAVNLGTGQGYSVLQVLKAFEKCNGTAIAYEIQPRRAGDIGQCFAKVDLAKQIMGFETEYGLDDMARDHINWVK